MKHIDPHRLKKQKPLPRGYGILMPIFSLDSPYGIGTLGESARAFVDFLSRAGAAIWQVLPLGPTGFGNSPYQCFSAFAGNPYFIDPGELQAVGWITPEEHREFLRPNTGRVDYGHLFRTRRALLRRAYEGFLKKGDPKEQKAFSAFRQKAAFWLEEHTAFAALKTEHPEGDRLDFDPLCLKCGDALARQDAAFTTEREFAAFLEFVFWEQWQQLKAYANARGIWLLGDIPLYVANDSADVWAHPELFMLEETGAPTHIAGVPPDSFSKTGQLWGNPLYRWERHAADDYAWWRARIAWQAECFDLLRLDHFIGLCRYYSIPAGETTAERGVWQTGPGKSLIAAMQAAAGKTKLIAEDLGLITPAVTRLMRGAGLPGMRLMQFAFSGEDNPNLPHNIPPNTVVYPGTHDNQTLRGFFDAATPALRKTARRYLDVRQNKALPHAVLRECFRSAANTAIVPFADLLGLDDTARINTPATTENNWCWRAEQTPDRQTADMLAVFAATYFRKHNTNGGLS